MNIQYIKFIRRFAVEKAQLDTAADVLIIGVNLAGALVGAASTKGILAAISGGTAASRISINKNFFHEQTVPVLITAMNAERKTALIPIFDGIGKTLDEYPFAQALSDLNFYYHAGTFIGALQAVQKDSGVKEDVADRKIIVIKRNIALAKKEARDRVSALLDKIDKLPNEKAMAMAKNPPVVGDEVIVAGLKAQDPDNNKPWITDPVAAKQALKFMLSLTSFSDLTKWETFLK